MRDGDDMNRIMKALVELLSVIRDPNMRDQIWRKMLAHYGIERERVCATWGDVEALVLSDRVRIEEEDEEDEEDEDLFPMRSRRLNSLELSEPDIVAVRHKIKMLTARAKMDEKRREQTRTPPTVEFEQAQLQLEPRGARKPRKKNRKNIQSTVH